jgi:hypothetical protein
LFIDGDHSYEGAAADFLTYRHLVRDGGVIAFHDICMDHGTRYGLETTSSSGEVYLLWRKLREAYEVQEFFASEGQDGAGIGALLYDPLRPLPTHVGRL